MQFEHDICCSLRFGPCRVGVARELVAGMSLELAELESPMECSVVLGVSASRTEEAEEGDETGED